jgi:hypothetical protein
MDTPNRALAVPPFRRVHRAAPLILAVLAAVATACWPETGEWPTAPDAGSPGAAAEPVSLVLSGDSVFAGVAASAGFTCRVRLTGHLSGGARGASISWQSAVITFRDPAGTQAPRSTSGWSSDFVTRFFGLGRPEVSSPAELSGGPLDFADPHGRPFVLELDFGYTPSDTRIERRATWRLRCS